MISNNEERLKIALKGGQIHSQIRNEIQEWIKPGMLMIDIANRIENRIKELTLYDINNEQS